MLFNTIEFGIFFFIVFGLYWLTNGSKKLLFQNLLLLIASYIFYGWWDYRFLSLIILSSLLDFSLGIQISKSENPRRRKFFLLVSLVVNLGLLGVFKYYNFFVDSLIEGAQLLGLTLNFTSLNIILPVGISFYTFQTLSYSIDVYRKNIPACRDIVSFFAFVSFFPQLVAGPIERATNLLPQFSQKRVFNFDDARDGCRQILFGLFKKVVIADNCAAIVDQIFSNYELCSSPLLFVGAILFAFQIYGDFSGYSDIAIGLSKLLGFKLMKNFSYPYFSRDIAEFWRRWHISLSSWFKDYLYIPLGGSRLGKNKSIRNIFIIFLVSGFWHGANWTFIAWGFINALCFLPLYVFNTNRNNLEIAAFNTQLPTFKELFQIFTTFLITCLAWVFFRSETITDSFYYLKRLFSFTFTSSIKMDDDAISLTLLFIFIFILIVVEWINRRLDFGLERMPKNSFIRYGTYLLFLLLISEFFVSKTDFIYFQF